MIAMHSHPVIIPKLNANDDRVVLVALFVKEGDRVEAGQGVALVETTKAAVEIASPAAGFVRGLSAERGTEILVGCTLCHIAESLVEGIAGEAAVVTERPEAAIHITVKARLRASELGVDLSRVQPVQQKIGVFEVEAFAGKRQAKPVPAASGPAMAALRAVIVGGGRHSACIADAVARSGYQLVGCVDSIVPKGTPTCGGLTVIGSEELLESLHRDGVTTAFIGVGGSTENTPRAKLYFRLREMGFHLPPLIHPAAYVAPGVTIGPGAVVLAMASIGPNCHIGANAIVNQGSVVCHDCVIEDHVHLAPGAILAGGCTIETGATVGMGATIYVAVVVGAWSLVHNSVPVMANVAPHTVVKLVTQLHSQPRTQTAP